MKLASNDQSPAPDITTCAGEIDDMLCLLEAAAHEARIAFAQGRESLRRSGDASPIQPATGLHCGDVGSLTAQSPRDAMRESAASAFRCGANNVARAMLLAQDITERKDQMDSLMQYVRS